MEKIFIIGCHKTGTTSVSRALTEFGYTFIHEPHSYAYIKHESSGEYDELKIPISKFDVFNDSPWNHADLYKWLYKNYPNAKFILTIRDTESWLGSYSRWEKRANIKKRWFYKPISQRCYGVDDFLANKTLMAQKYNQRNAEIIEFFKDKGDFLLFDIENNNGWKDICEFLGKDIPNIPFPHRNRTK